MTTPTAASSVRILLVDDNASKRLAVRAVLTPLGYPIVEADSGVAALRCLMAQNFAVILLDVCMPVMDGFETAALIRQRAESEMTPIIFFTAYGREDIGAADRYSGGAVDFMFAPVPPNELRAKVSVFANLFIRADELAAQAREVRTSVDQLRLLTDEAPIGIFQTDAEGRFVYVNARWSEITGVSAERAAGETWNAIIDSEERPNGRRDIRLPGGESRIVVATGREVSTSDGATQGKVGTLADVTVEAHAEAAMSAARDAADAASQLKSDFLANMSHEIRTPMNGVIGMTDLLLETALSDVQRDYAQTVRTSGQALMAIIDDILDFSKIEAGKLEVEQVEFSVATVVGEVVDLLVGPARGKGLRLVAASDTSVPATVCGDPGRVRQVLTNLIGNAIKFTKSGDVGVRLSGTVVEDGESVVRFEVTDTGVGIAADKLSSIFHPFVQADTSTSRRYGGTGLGLAISGQLVALMGGECGVSSELGAGSTFWFTVRVGTMRTSPQVVASEAVVVDHPVRPGQVAATGRLLLAEDNLINQKVALAMLAGVGYDVDTVLNGAEAVQAVAGRRYDAILMDCHMPEMNGYEATAAIRAHDGSVRHTPIIAMTASARGEDRDRCLSVGMDGYLAKPVNKDALLALVAQSVREGRIDEPTLNLRVLEQLRILGESAGEDLLGDLIEQFARDKDPMLAELRAAFESADAAAVARMAHTIKGSGGQLGSGRLAASCSRLEIKATAGCLSDDQADLRAVELTYAEALDALTECVALAP